MKHKIERRIPKEVLDHADKIQKIDPAQLEYVSTIDLLKHSEVKLWDRILLVYSKHSWKIRLTVEAIARGVKLFVNPIVGEILDKLADGIQPVKLLTKKGVKVMEGEKGLTKGEVMQVLGRALESAGVAFDDDESPNKITLAEILDLVQGIAKDAIKEWND